MENREHATVLTRLWNMITSLPVKRRKQVVMLCRAQEIIFDQPFNLLCIQTSLTDTRSPGGDREFDEYIRVVRSAAIYIVSPYMSSVVLDMCRSCPLSSTECEEERLKSWGKEIKTCERGERDLHFDYSCWFSPNDIDRPIVAGTLPNPRMATTIQHALQSWRRRVQDTLLFPRISSKSVSRETVRQWEKRHGRDWESRESHGGVEFTQRNLEREYHEQRDHLSGPSEIRQKWYRSGVTPRTYFASGGTAYEKSKYIQEPAGMLTEELDTTHPISRLNPARIILRDWGRYLRIYDLTAFTSNHWECKHFVRCLASWCSGTTVKVMDACEGVVELDLGVLLEEYNETCNFSSSYDATSILDDIDGFLCHNQAGFLGIYGNINFSTFLHGASLLMALESTDEANVAGDDAHYSEMYGMEDVSDRFILANGVFESTKVFRSDQIGAVCLKRGVTQEGLKILPKLMVVFPSFSIIGSMFDFHPPQFPMIKKAKTERVNMICNEVYRFLQGVFYGPLHDDLAIILDLLKSLYNLLHLPVQGSLPPWGDRLVPVLPETYDGLTQLDPIDALLRYHFSDPVVLPKIDDHDEVYDPPQTVDHYVGYDWYSRSSRYLNYLELLGYVEQELQEELVYGEEAWSRMRDMFLGRRPIVYRYRILREIPFHLKSLEYGI